MPKLKDLVIPVGDGESLWIAEGPVATFLRSGDDFAVGIEFRRVDPEPPYRMAARYEVVGLSIGTGAGDQQLTGETLRRIPLGRIEAALNSRRIQGELESRVDLQPKRRLDQPLDSSTRYIQDWPANQPPPPTLNPNLRDGRKRPDEFYRQVAECFDHFSRLGMNPIEEIAGLAGVKYSAATYWVGEARRRGILAPAPHKIPD